MFLTRSAGEFSDMEDKILPVLKYSYDNWWMTRPGYVSSIVLCFQKMVILSTGYVKDSWGSTKF